MLTTQCHSSRIMTPPAFRLFLYKPQFDYAGQHHSSLLSCLRYRDGEWINSQFCSVLLLLLVATNRKWSGCLCDTNDATWKLYLMLIFLYFYWSKTVFLRCGVATFIQVFLPPLVWRSICLYLLSCWNLPHNDERILINNELKHSAKLLTSMSIYQLLHLPIQHFPNHLHLPDCKETENVKK